MARNVGRPRGAVIGLTLVGGLSVFAGCGDEPAPPVVTAPSAPASELVPEGYDGRFRTYATVLDSPEHGPQLCHGVDQSLPPQCGGPDIAGWDWSAVEAESVGGTTWGEYVLVGTYDGDVFTLTEPAVVDDGTQQPVSDEPDLSTPCAEPDGGWTSVDPERATEAAFNAAVDRARATDGFGGVWIDQRLAGTEQPEATLNGPERFVLNVTTAGNPSQMHEAVREIWGGALCVSVTSRSAVELEEIQAAVADLPGLLSSGTDMRAGQVVVTVLVATVELQAELDERNGDGAVRLSGVLEPID